MKYKTLKKTAEILLACLMVAFLCLSIMVSAEETGTSTTPMSTQTTAATTTAKGNFSMADLVAAQKTIVTDNQVFQIRIGYEFDDGSFDEWAHGTGFLVGNKYIMTSQVLSDTSMSSSLFATIVETRGNAYARVGITLTDATVTEKHIQIYVTDFNGERYKINTTITKSGMGVIILSEAVETTPCIFASQALMTFEADDIVNIKYTGDNDTKCYPLAAKGVVYEKKKETAGANFYFTADMTKGNPVGAPIYNDNGNIVGMVSSVLDAENGSTMALYADAIESFLTANSISYKTIEQEQAESQAEEADRASRDAEEAAADMIDTTSLEQAIKNAEEYDASQYTKESFEGLTSALKLGKDLLGATKKTQAEIDAAATNINTAINDLVKAGFITKLMNGQYTAIIGIIGACIAAVAIAVTLVMAKMGKFNKKKEDVVTPEEEKAEDYSENLSRTEEDLEREMRNKENLQKAKEEREKEERNAFWDYEEEEEMVEGDDIVEDDQNLDITVRKKPKSARVPGNVQPDGIQYATNIDDDRVELLDLEGEEDTTLLDSKKKGYLRRLDNGNKITIERDNFVIGKERKSVDYCISGNTSVSRNHARIRLIEDGFYIEDLKSTNYTYVNNQQIPEYKPVLLQDGTIVRLSNVEFEFLEE